MTRERRPKIVDPVSPLPTDGRGIAGRGAPRDSAHPHAQELEQFWDDTQVRQALDAWIASGLAEDHADDDITTQALFGSDGAPVRGRITAGADGVICGVPAALAVFRALGNREMTLLEGVPDGTPVTRGATVLELETTALALLAGERTALNILGHLSGIATRTRTWVEHARGVRVLDTRKTLPGIRCFQKHAVLAGGGSNHRMHLADCAMVKENHRRLYQERQRPGSTSDEIAGIVARLRAAPECRGRPIIIEVEDEASFQACVRERVDVVLLDNRTPEEIRAWIAAAGVDAAASTALEASGGITVETLPAYAESGVTRVSMGALTHSAGSLDLSLHVVFDDTIDEGVHPR